MCLPSVYDGFIQFQVEKQPDVVHGWAGGGQVRGKLLEKRWTGFPILCWKNNLEHGHFISLGLDLLLASVWSWKLLLTGLIFPVPFLHVLSGAWNTPEPPRCCFACLTLLPQLAFDEHRNVFYQKPYGPDQVVDHWVKGLICRLQWWWDPAVSISFQ